MTEYEPPTNEDNDPIQQSADSAEPGTDSAQAAENAAELSDTIGRGGELGPLNEPGPLDEPDRSDEAEAAAAAAFEQGIFASDQTVETEGPVNPPFTDEELEGAATDAPFGDTGDIEDPSPAAGEPSSTDQEPNIPPPNDPPPPGPYASTPVRRVYRSRHDRRVSGVSGGLAEYFRIDPTLVRIATVVLLLTGVGIFAYLIAWVVLPLGPEDHYEAPPATSRADERTMTIAFGVAALAIAFGITTGSWAVLSLALIGGGIWLLSEHTSTAPASAMAASGMSAYQAPPVAPGVQWPPQPVAGNSRDAPPLPGAATAPAPAPRRPRQRQSVTWTVLSLLALLTAVGVAAASGDWWNVSATRFLGIGVVIIGIGVVVGQIRRGGARGLIPLGILAAIALFPVSAVDGLLDDGIGESFHRPSDFTEFSTTYEHGIGTMTVDLSRLDFEGRSETVDIELGIGELIVIVSDETGGEAILEATAGEISHEISRSSSLRFEEGVNVDTGIVQLEGANGTLDLNIAVGLGTAELRTRGN